MRLLHLFIFLSLPLLSFGQATPVVVADICPGGCSSNPSNLVEWNGKVYFFATSPTAGRELHVYDGTSVSVVADINAGSGDGVRSSSSLALLNNKLYFAANDTVGATVHYVYSYDGSNAPQKILLANGQPLRSRGPLAASGNDLLMEYNDSSNRYRLAKYVSTSGAVQIVSTNLYTGAYLGFSGLQTDGNFATHGGQLYSNSAKQFVCNLATGTVVGTPTSHVGIAAMGPDGVYLPFSDITNVDPGAPGTGGTHLSRFGYAPFSWTMLTVGATNATLPALDRGTPAVYNGNVYYAGQTTPGTIGPTPPLSLRKYDPASGTTTIVASLPAAGMTDRRFSYTCVVGGVMYVNYRDSLKGRELFGYNGGASFIPITDIDGASAGLDPTSIVGYNGNLLIAGTTSTNGTELYRIAGTGLSLTDAQQSSAAILSPNPASAQLTITLPKSGRYLLRILSTTGQTLRSQIVEGASPSISVADLAAGLYFAQITDAASGILVGTARFVKE